MRLDVFMVESGIVPTRTKAKTLIDASCVLVNGKIKTKASAQVDTKDKVELQDKSILRYVSRGGLKLERAIEEFNLDFSGMRILDIGSSTGGFTDCALQHGAAHVNSVDVGTDCMDATLRADTRISLYEKTDIRNAPFECFLNIDYVVCDASFVSLTTVLAPVIERIEKPKIIALIKPQFECGANIAKKYKGVITNFNVHKDVLNSVIGALNAQGLSLLKLCPSPIKGKDGNIEYLAYFENQNGAYALCAEEIEAIIKRAFA
jgi:23S rRNA (cytidine1920-2'-O)/16S rRNA (cytidine1409-2'-O)-methyltransferase